MPKQPKQPKPEPPPPDPPCPAGQPPHFRHAWEIIVRGPWRCMRAGCGYEKDPPPAGERR